MGFQSLVSLPTELLHYLCWFLCQIDILALSQTCLHLHHALNDNSVWKRFVTEEVRSLETRKQQLNPPFHPDSTLCENLQHVLRKNRLLSNWKNGKCTMHSNEHGVKDILQSGLVFYNNVSDNYLFDEDDRQIIQFQDISKSPNLRLTMPFNQETVKETFLIEDYLVVVRLNRVVEVYQINIEERTSPLLYSFLVGEDKVVNGIIPHGRDVYNWCCCTRAGNYLVLYLSGRNMDYPDVHIWDIVNARKVGDFTSPMRGDYVRFKCIDSNCIILCVSTSHYEDHGYLKFDLITKRLLQYVFRRNTSDYSCMFYQDHCIVMKRSEERKDTVVCEVFEFNTSVKVRERVFEQVNLLNKCCLKQHEHIIDGKLIISSSERFHVVNALTLDTVVVVPHGPDVYTILKPISVFGSLFLLTAHKDKTINIWDLERKTCTELPVQTYCERRSIGYIVLGKPPLTKFVIFGRKKMYVVQFW